MKTAQRLLGFKEEGRIVADFYPTPDYAINGLLDNEKFLGTVWECACGDGAISKILEKRGFKVTSTDIIYRGFGSGDVDFLQEKSFYYTHEKHDNIITNPPFNKATEFVVMAKKFSNNKIAMFLKTTFLEGIERNKLFTDKNFPLKCIYQFVKRVSFGGNKGDSGMMSFAWFVWDREYKGEPVIRWIKS